MYARTQVNRLLDLVNHLMQTADGAVVRKKILTAVHEEAVRLRESEAQLVLGTHQLPQGPATYAFLVGRGAEFSHQEFSDFLSSSMPDTTTPEIGAVTVLPLHEDEVTLIFPRSDD